MARKSVKLELTVEQEITLKMWAGFLIELSSGIVGEPR